MKELFQMLNDPRFHLLYGVTQRFSTGPEPQLVRLNREGFKLVEGVTKKTLVHPRMRLAAFMRLSYHEKRRRASAVLRAQAQAFSSSIRPQPPSLRR